MFKRFSGNLSVLTLSLLASLLVAEVVLRLFLPAPIVFKVPQETHVFDQEIGFRLTPGQVSYTQDKPVLVNSQGVRGPEYSSEPPAGTYRILTVGDSQTFGNGLVLADSWPGILERTSNDGGHSVEVVNGGWAASDTWQHDILGLRLAQRYHPNALILAVYVNDVREIFVPRESAVFVSNSRVQRLKYLLKRSAIVGTVYDVYRSYRARRAASNEPQWDQKVIQGSDDPAIERAWTQVETSLRSIRDWSERMNIRFLVIALPHRAQVSGIMTGEVHSRRLRDIAQRNGIPFVDLLPALKAAYDVHGSKLFIPWDGHNSAVANKVIAEQVYRRISDVIASHALTP